MTTPQKAKGFKNICACGCGGSPANRNAEYIRGHRPFGNDKCYSCGEKSSSSKSKYCLKCREDIRRATMDSSNETRRKKSDPRLSVEMPPGKYFCTKCQEYLPVSKFHYRKGKPSGYCKECRSVEGHSNRLKRVFGITADDYNMMLDEQGGACAICSMIPKKKRLAVDHNHATGQIRGLLCSRCNHRVLGGAKEDANILRKAADYLENPPCQHHGFVMDI